MSLTSPEDFEEQQGSRRGRYLFDDFELDLGRCSLIHRGEEVALRPKSFAMLQFLLEHAGQLVTRSELLDAVWPGVVVGDDSITQCLLELRRKLGDDQHSLIRTVPRHGVIFEGSVVFEDSTAPAFAEHSEPVVRRFWVFAAVLVAIVAVFWWWVHESNPDGQPLNERITSPGSGNSIAVLRFANLSPDSDLTYLSDGFSEEIIHMLAQRPGLRVIARTSSFAVEGQSISRVAETLDVSHVLEGSLRKEGKKIRIMAQLIDASTSAHIWSRTYDRNLDDILDVQREIAHAVATALDVTLQKADLATDIDPHAFQLYLEGRHFQFSASASDLVRARERYEAALSISPRFARAWVGLSAVTFNLLAMPQHYEYTPEEREQLRELNKHATEQALQYGSDLAVVHMRVARLHFFEGDRARAREHVEIARSIDPDHWLVRYALITELINTGRIDEAIPLVRHNMQRDPLNIVLRENLVGFLIWARRYEEAREELANVLGLTTTALANSQFLQLHRARLQILAGEFEEAVITADALTNDGSRLQVLAIANEGLGSETNALASLEILVELADENWEKLKMAEVHAWRGDGEKALSWLARINFSPNCETDNFLADVYYSPFLAALEGNVDWEGYRATTLQMMRSCLLGLELPARP